MLFDEKQIPELYYLKSKWNNNPNARFDWENNILKKSTSPILFNNPKTQGYLVRIEKMVSLMVDSIHIVRNYFNIGVDRYHNDHWN